jgi:hypothetical protein
MYARRPEDTYIYTHVPTQALYPFISGSVSLNDIEYLEIQNSFLTKLT